MNSNLKKLISVSASMLLILTMNYNLTLPFEVNAVETIQVDKSMVEKPIFSQKGGFYENSFDLTIKVSSDCKVYYTLDGSNPTTDSIEYVSPIHIYDNSTETNNLSAKTDIAPNTINSIVSKPINPVDKAIIVKAIAVDNNGNSSEIVTNSYFIGYDSKSEYYQDMKVISIVTDSDNLFDYNTGIYVLGKTYDAWKDSEYYDASTPSWEMPANYMQKGSDWERPATMQIFDNGNLELSQDVGIRIHGGATRSYTQKSFNVYARSKYGNSKIKYDLLSSSVTNEYDGSIITKFDSFTLRNGGNDAQYSRIRDKLNQELVSNRAFLTQGMKPCIVFINGEYWGQYEITEKLSDYFIQSHYGIDKENVCIIKNQTLEEGTEQDYQDYQNFVDWVNVTDFSIDENYQELCSKMDIQSYIDYMSSEIYFNNWDWGGNNVAMWKSVGLNTSNPYDDGKWRFIMFDTEFSVDLYGDNGADTNTFSQVFTNEYNGFIFNMFKSLLANDTFKQQFVTSFTDIANVNFDSSKISTKVDEYSNTYKSAVIDTFNRFWANWPGGYMAEKQFQNEISSIKTFYNQRFSYITKYLADDLELKGKQVEVTINNDNKFGDIQLNTSLLDNLNGSWNGKYYTDYPITITAIPKDGYTFSHWEVENGTISGKETSNTIEVSFNENVTITAVYQDNQNIVLGDINLDGNVTPIDLLALKTHILGILPLSDESLKNADINKDALTNIIDILILKKDLLTL